MQVGAHTQAQEHTHFFFLFFCKLQKIRSAKQGVHLLAGERMVTMQRRCERIVFHTHSDLVKSVKGRSLHYCFNNMAEEKTKSSTNGEERLYTVRNLVAVERKG